SGMGGGYDGKDMGDRGITDRHQVELIPVAGLVISATLVEPQRKVAANQRGRNDVELEDVGELVRDGAVEQVRRLVERQKHPITFWLGEGGDTLDGGAGDDVLLLEFAARLENDQRHFECEVVL